MCLIQEIQMISVTSAEIHWLLLKWFMGTFDNLRRPQWLFTGIRRWFTLSRVKLFDSASHPWKAR